jgi:hypothetical protein
MAMLSRRIGVLEKRTRRAAAMPATAGGGRPLTGKELADRLGTTGETVRRWAGLGMPSCGTHPSRPSWAMYDEAACRAWAAANQPQTALTPAAAGDAGATGQPGGGESVAELRARRLHLQCRLMRQRLVEEQSRHMGAEDARVVWRRHAGVVRETLGGLPAQTAGRLAEAFGLGEDTQERFRTILAAEMARVIAEVKDDPLTT